MLRKTLRAIGWSAAGLVACCVLLYLGVLAVNWRDREPNAAAIELGKMFRDRPAVADEDNGYVYLQRWELLSGRREQLPARVREFLQACGPSQEACVGAFDAADGLFDEWQAVEGSLLDKYLAFAAHTGWREDSSFIVAESVPPYAGASDGQRLLLLRARDLAKQRDAAAVRTLLESDLQFWRMVLQSSDILISKMIATAALERHFEWGYRIVARLPPDQIGAAIPDGWRNGISAAERSMIRCMAGEWMFTSETLQTMATSQFGLAEDPTLLERISRALARPMFQLQDTRNRAADQYWELGHTFEVPLERYEDALHRADELTERMAEEAAVPRIYNSIGAAMVSLSGVSQYAARVGDIEGVRRAALLAATLRAAKTEAEDIAAAVASAELHNPYTGRPLEWDAAKRAIVFHGLATGVRGEHLIYY